MLDYTKNSEYESEYESEEDNEDKLDISFESSEADMFVTCTIC